MKCKQAEMETHRRLQNEQEMEVWARLLSRELETDEWSWGRSYSGRVVKGSPGEVACPALWPRGLQHARRPCPSPSAAACSNSWPLSQWYHPTISSSLIPYLPSIFPSIRVFSSELALASGGQSTEASASASVLPMNIQGWFPLGLTGLILLFKGLSRVFSSIAVLKHQFLRFQPSLWSNSHIRTWLPEKP